MRQEPDTAETMELRHEDPLGKFRGDRESFTSGLFRAYLWNGYTPMPTFAW